MPSGRIYWRRPRQSNYRGRVVLLNFWASGCGGCVLEIPSLVRIDGAFHGQPFTVVGISMDMSYENITSPAQA
ncbi:MAG: peroxiredoxin family protein [Terriglobales bacterium]